MRRQPNKKLPPVPEAERIKVRDLRAHLKAHLSGPCALLVGSAWRPKAIILPVHESWEHGAQADRVRRARLRALLESALQKLSHW